MNDRSTTPSASATDRQPGAMIETLGDLLQALPHFRDLPFEAKVLTTPAATDIGTTCARILVGANALAQICPDVHDQLIDVISGQISRLCMREVA